MKTSTLQNYICLVVTLWGAAAAHGAVVTVPAGGNLQQAINNASPGDTIVLQAGATYTGNFTLPNKGSSSTAYITITSSMAASLPAGLRVNPSQASLMATLAPPNGAAAIGVNDYAHHYQLIGLEIHPPAGVYSGDLVTLGSGGTTSLAALPHDLIVDRCYIHGDAVAGGKRGVALNSGTAVIQNSYISGLKSTWQDTTAVGGWSGSGPFTIVNNYLEAGAESILFGGAPPSIAGLVPSNITIQGNYMSKPLSWYPGSPTYGGTTYVVKNVLELKSAKNVTITGNVMENSWVGAQNGFVVVVTVRTESGADPTAVVQNVTFQNNLIRNAPSGVNMGGIDDNGMGSTSGVAFKNNVFLINAAAWGLGPGRLFQIVSGMNNLTIDHNTGISDANLSIADGSPSYGFLMQNNMVFSGPYGFFGSGSSTGTLSLNTYFPGAIFRNNAIIGGYGPRYPAGNFFPATPDQVGFANYANANYALSTTSPYIAAATDGTPLGADVTGLQPVFAAAIAGTASAGTTPITTPVTAPVSSPTPTSTFTPVRVNAGGAGTVDGAGQTWSADMDFSGGSTWAVTNGIAGTTAPAVYQTCRYGPSFSYNVPVPNGMYNVTLKFAEPVYNRAGGRQFNLAINGSPVLANFDVYAAAGAMFTAVDKTFPVTVTNGQITLSFTDGPADSPMVSGIQIPSAQ